MRSKLGNIAYVPNMISDPILVRVHSVHFIAGDLFTDRDGLKHGTIRKSRTARIIDLAAARVQIKMPKHIYQIIGVNIIPYLFLYIQKLCTDRERSHISSDTIRSHEV